MDNALGEGNIKSQGFISSLVLSVAGGVAVYAIEKLADVLVERISGQQRRQRYGASRAHHFDEIPMEIEEFEKRRHMRSQEFTQDLMGQRYFQSNEARRRRNDEVQFA
ncbi:unnamed protein product [Caenorhabditis bovis]|uniref:Uncharacterized protein n=1 Tax=Caenorhabditis bovis TaxID=2654633 RepID=A0A8S1F3N2_9PELO|nr:unnamed protein product [Caenorhabditis bovis]